MSVRNGRERLAEVMNQAILEVGGIPSNTLARDEILQLMDGFAAVVQEGVQGKSNELRTLYVEVVIPALVRRGIDAGTAARLMREWLDKVHTELRTEVRTLADSREAMQWLEGFSREMSADVQRAAQATGTPPTGSAFFDTVVTTSGLSRLIGPNVVARACDMSGLDAPKLAPEQLEDMLPPLRKAMSVFLGNPEMDRALKRLEALRPRPMEELPA
jgi:hypothetical protein